MPLVHSIFWLSATYLKPAISILHNFSTSLFESPYLVTSCFSNRMKILPQNILGKRQLIASKTSWRQVHNMIQCACGIQPLSGEHPSLKTWV